jgi:hypothetical protein
LAQDSPGTPSVNDYSPQHQILHQPNTLPHESDLYLQSQEPSVPPQQTHQPITTHNSQSSAHHASWEPHLPLLYRKHDKSTSSTNQESPPKHLLYLSTSLGPNLVLPTENGPPFSLNLQRNVEKNEKLIEGNIIGHTTHPDPKVGPPKQTTRPPSPQEGGRVK